MLIHEVTLYCGDEYYSTKEKDGAIYCCTKFARKYFNCDADVVNVRFYTTEQPNAFKVEYNHDTEELWFNSELITTDNFYIWNALLKNVFEHGKNKIIWVTIEE